MTIDRKPLTEMSLAELWQLFPIILREHDPRYATWYEEERVALSEALKGFPVSRVSHIGSTAVKGLTAKPIIDILLELAGDCDIGARDIQTCDIQTCDIEACDIEAVAAVLTANGWLVMARDDATRTLDLNKGYTPQGFAEKVYHLHIKPAGDWGELYFRDYLRSHDEVAGEYERLKRRLREQYEHDRDAYTAAKTDFVRQYTQAAREEFGRRYTGIIP